MNFQREIRRLTWSPGLRIGISVRQKRFLSIKPLILRCNGLFCSQKAIATSAVGILAPKNSGARLTTRFLDSEKSLRVLHRLVWLPAVDRSTRNDFSDARDGRCKHYNKFLCCKNPVASSAPTIFASTKRGAATDPAFFGPKISTASPATPFQVPGKSIATDAMPF